MGIMEILEILLREPGLTHNGILIGLKGGNRNKVLKTINDLVRQGYIREQKQGRKRLCYLTKKGEKALLNRALKRANEGLKIVEEWTSKLLKEKSALEEWRKTNIEALFNVVKGTPEMSDKELFIKIQAERRRLFGPLVETYKNMHKLICEAFLYMSALKEVAPEVFDYTKYFIGFDENGELRFIHVNALPKPNTQS
jgi:predicted transcriptional regulator